MSKLLPVLFGLSGAGGLALLLSKKAHAAETEHGDVPTTDSGQPIPVTATNLAKPAPGNSVAERIANAIAAGPEAMRATAAELRREGQTAAADALLDQLQPVKSAGQPTATRDDGTGTVTTEPAPVSVPDSPAFFRAKLLSDSLRSSPPTRGDARVRQYQGNEGLVVDGLYGPNTATAVARAGVIPYPPTIFARDPVKRKASIEKYRGVVAEQERLLGGDWSSALKGLPL